MVLDMCCIDMIWVQPPRLDGIICPSTIPLELMLFDIWIQVSVLADLIQDVINSPFVYLVLCCTCLNGLGSFLLAGVTSW